MPEAGKGLTPLRKEGRSLIIQPAPPKTLLTVLASLPPLEEDFAGIANMPPDDVPL